MSAAHHNDHAFDGEPVDELPPDEPKTPAWLTGLGAALMLSAAVFFMVSGRGDPAAGSAAPEAAPVVAAPVVVAPPAAAPAPAPAANAGDDGARAREAMQRSPEQMRLIKERLDQMRKERAAAGQPPLPIPAPAPAP